MDWRRWKRDPDKTREALHVQSDGSVVTTRGLKIYVPERFKQKKLADISARCYIVGIYAMVVDDAYYGVDLTNAMMQIVPTAIRTVKFDQETYLEFSFDPGSIVFATTQLLKSDTLVYYIFDELFAKGRTPWYINYEDRGLLFASADKHAGVSLSGNHSILEMIAAATARNADNRSRYYRQGIESQEDIVKHPPAIVPLRSITYGATNTTSKLTGSYWDDGLDSALVTPSEQTERIETILRR
jgi:hypothetical protein